MDYKAFFWDVYMWTQQVNQEVLKHGMNNPDFWQWVADSAGELCKKYQETPLVIKQMMMLVEWLEEVAEKQKEVSHGTD